MLVRQFIGQPLSSDALDRDCSAGSVIKAERDPMVVTEVKFAEIPLQMLGADVVIDAIYAALEDREVALNSVGVRVAPDVFLGGVVHGLMACEALADFCINAALVSTQMRLGRNLLFEDRLQIGRVDVRHMKGCDAAVALDQRNYGFLGS